jgi:hypothetical protein
MESIRLQLELEPHAITIRANILQGVITTKTFEGHECYMQMLSFIKQAYPDDQFILATIVIK